MTTSPRDKWATLGQAALFFLLTWLAFGRALHAPFIFDDYSGVVDNGSIRQLWPLSAVFNPPVPSCVAGRPLVNFTFAVSYYFSELDPVGYRVFNMAVHALSALVLFRLLRRTLRLPYFDGNRTDSPSDWGPWAVTLLWTVHPLQTEAVCYVAQRTELMMGFCYLATLYCALRYWTAPEPSGRLTWCALAWLACLAGMASKEVMVSAPIFVLLYERAFVTRSFRRALASSWPLYVALASTWILLFALVSATPRSASAGFHLVESSWNWWMTQCHVIVMYLRLSFWPWPLSIHYDLPVVGLADAWPAVAAVAILVLLTVAGLWRNSPSGVLGSWFFFILAPTSVIPIVTEIAAERRMHLPLISVLTIVVFGAIWLLDRRRDVAPVWRGVAAVAVVLVAGLLAWGSFDRLAVYRDDVTLWQDTLAKYPNSDTVNVNLGDSLRASGRLADSLPYFAEAVRISPHFADFRLQYNRALRESGHFDEATTQAEEALRIDPQSAEALYDLGLSQRHLGNKDAAVERFAGAVEIEPDNAVYLAAYGLALNQVDRLDEAIAALKQAVEIAPDTPNIQFNLAALLKSAGKVEAAAGHYAEAVRLAPKDADYRNNYGNVLRLLEKHEAAVTQLEEALRLAPNSWKAHYNLALALAEMQRPAEALAHAQKALEFARAEGRTDMAAEIEEFLASIQKE